VNIDVVIELEAVVKAACCPQDPSSRVNLLLALLNVACGFPAPRASEVGSQHRECLQLPIGEAQFRSQQRCPLFDLVEEGLICSLTISV
jgi:hypothetical protein